MTVLIIAEHNNHKVQQSTLHAINGAQKLGDVHLLVASEAPEAVAEQAAKIAGVQKVLVAKAEHYAHLLPEEIAPLIVQLAADYHYVAAAASTFGKNILPRVAALLHCPQISDVVEVLDKETFIHPVYAGNALQTVKNKAAKIALTFRSTAFEKAAEAGGQAEVMTVEASAAQNISRFVAMEEHKSDRPELTDARIIVSGGRGLGSKEKFNEVITPLADVLGAAIGASRAAVDSGYVPNDYQVGQTGKVVAPELYIAVGISGAIQHIAGMHDSKIIVAINQDPDAPIFNIANYGIVGDLFKVAPELTEALKAAK